MVFSKKLKNGNGNAARQPVPSLFPEYAIARRKMIEQHLLPRGITDKKVLEMMEKTPRHLFVEDALISQAYGDSALSIGFKQTISQPFTVALLAQSLSLKGFERVLEIGTGCGYQTAILAGLARKVYSIERLKPLVLKARNNLKKLEIRNVILKYGDGSRGWEENAPFEAIVAAAVSPSVPKPLLSQLADGGRLVVPIEKNGKQYLVCVTREKESFRESVIQECRFVKMVGHHAFEESKKKSVFGF